MAKSLRANNLGKLTIEDCSVVDVSKVIKNIKIDYANSIENMTLSIEGMRINLTATTLATGGRRLWLQCPNCLRRVHKLRIYPDGSKIGCQRCLKLLYRKQKYHKMIEENSIQKMNN
jgi:hypothetical protein